MTTRTQASDIKASSLTQPETTVRDADKQHHAETLTDATLWADESKYVWLRATGEQISVLPLSSKTKFSLAELRRFVGGTIQLASLDSQVPYAYMRGGLVRDKWVLVVNDNGLNERLPINQTASELWGGMIVGDVLLCRRSAIR